MTGTFDALSWPVRTQRLTIRPATPADVEATWRVRRLDEVNRWITRAPTTLEDHRAHFVEPHRLAVTLVVELGAEVIGDLMLRVDDGWAQAEVAEQARGVQAELGWVLHPDHGGNGYGTEAVRGLLRLCFEDLGLRRVTAGCFAANEPSWRLMERVGMRRESVTVRESLHRSGQWLDGLGYALLAEEWRDLAGRGTTPTPVAAVLDQDLPARLRIEVFPADLDPWCDFWSRVMGFTLVRDERRSTSPYVAVERGEVRIGAARRDDAVDPAARRPPTGTEMVLEVADVVAERDRVAASWPLEEDLVRRPWGLTDFRLLDPAGYYVRVTSHP